MKRLLFSLAALKIVVPAIWAGTNGFIVPFFRGASNSTVGYWETFTVPLGAPGNLPDKAGATTHAVLSQTETNAFLTGSGNIYNLTGLSSFHVADSTTTPVETVVLQARGLGAELDYNSVLLTHTNETGPHSLPPLPRVELERGEVPGLGATVSSLWQWDLHGLNVTNYVISFNAGSPSLSFDSMTLDTWEEFQPLFGRPFSINDTTPVIERWMYGNNAAPCDRPASSTFGTLGDESGVDTRHAQHLVGWDTSSLITTNRGATNYLVSRCRLTLTINRGNLFAYDPTQDDYRTYFETNHPAFLADPDAGRPLELFGAGYRNGFDAASFDQCALFGTNNIGERNAFAVGWSTNGTLVDVSNNVGKTNLAFTPFEVAPFAIGQTTNVAPGELVPAGAKITFDPNLADPLVLAYLREALNTGRLRLMLSSIHTSGGELGTPSYPDFATHFSQLMVDPTRLELEGAVISDADVDSDGLPDDWEMFYFKGLSQGPTGDPDGDGISNLDEFHASTDPSRVTDFSRLVLTSVDQADHVTLQFSYGANHRYSLETSDNLTSWTTLTNPPVYLLGTNIVEWRDAATPSTQRFYRVRGDH